MADYEEIADIIKDGDVIDRVRVGLTDIVNAILSAPPTPGVESRRFTYAKQIIDRKEEFDEFFYKTLLVERKDLSNSALRNISDVDMNAALMSIYDRVMDLRL